MQRSGPRPLRHLLQAVVDLVLHEVDRLGPADVRASARRSGTLSMAITRPAPSIQALRMANCADRAAAPDRDGVALLDVAFSAAM